MSVGWLIAPFLKVFVRAKGVLVESFELLNTGRTISSANNDFLIPYLYLYFFLAILL